MRGALSIFVLSQRIQLNLNLYLKRPHTSPRLMFADYTPTEDFVSQARFDRTKGDPTSRRTPIVQTIKLLKEFHNPFISLRTRCYLSTASCTRGRVSAPLRCLGGFRACHPDEFLRSGTYIAKASRGAGQVQSSCSSLGKCRIAERRPGKPRAAVARFMPGIRYARPGPSRCHPPRRAMSSLLPRPPTSLGMSAAGEAHVQ